MLVLFDIDGTLLRRMPPAHRLALCDAMRDHFGLEMGPEVLGQTAGKTDTAIVRAALRASGIAPEAAMAKLPALWQTAATAYARHVPDDLRPYHTPAARATLDRLQAAGIALGLVTGNVERIAWTKLERAGLRSYFACGGFGDEAEARDALPPLAVARARWAFGREFAPEEIVVVGDTPADIACGAASGYRTIAVATGPVHDRATLAACGPEAVLETLDELAPLLL